MVKKVSDLTSADIASYIRLSDCDENEIETVRTLERQREKQFDEKNVFTSKTGLLNII